MKRVILAAVSSLALAMVAAPAAAQSSGSQGPTQEELDAMGSLFGDMFGTAEPLSPEEEARLGGAMQVVTKLFPKGTYAKMMEESMGPLLEGMMGATGGSPAINLSGLTGIDPITLGTVEEDKLKAAMALLDPKASERDAAMGNVMFEIISEVVVEIEPAYRAGLARAYAVRFSADELADLSKYFATPVGRKYAAESFLIFADPQVMSAMNEVMPVMMQRMPAMMEAMSSVAEQFPDGRSFSALGASERAKLASLLGVSEQELADAEPAATSNAF